MQVICVVAFFWHCSSALAASQIESSAISVTVVSGSPASPAPVILRVEDKTTNELRLIVEVDSAHQSESLHFIVHKANTLTGVTTEQSYVQTTDVNARASLDVVGLNSGVEYEFSVQYAPSGAAYSDSSAVYSVVTVINPLILNTVNEIINQSVELELEIPVEFIGSDIDFVVEVTGDNIYTVQSTAVVGSQNIVLLVDSLTEGASYIFRVKYAREGTLNFSEYSNTKEIVIKDSDDESTEDISGDDYPRRPVIKNIYNKTDDTVVVVVRIRDYPGEEVELVLYTRNTKTGEINMRRFNNIVSNDGTVTLAVKDLDFSTYYEFKIKYSVDKFDRHSKYSYIKKYYTEMPHVDEYFIICYNNETIDIEATELHEYLKHGAIRGRCEKIYQDRRVEVCYQGETVWTERDSQIYRDAKIGVCITEWDEEIDAGVKLSTKEDKGQIMRLVIGIIGVIAGAIIVLNARMIPFFTTTVRGIGDIIKVQIIQLLKGGLIGRKKSITGCVFDSETNMPITAAKITLLFKDGERVEVAYSGEDGVFSFFANPGEYMIKVKKNGYVHITNVNERMLYKDVYKGQKIVVDLNRSVVKKNIAIKREGIDSNKYIELEKEYSLLVERVKKFLAWGIYTLGFFGALVVVYQQPSVCSLILIGVYIAILIIIVFLGDSKYGFVRMSNGTPVKLAVIGLYDKINDERQQVTITDVSGRYFLPTINGSHRMNVKSQDFSDSNIDKNVELFVKNERVTKKIKI